MKVHTLEDLFVEELRDLYNAENQILKALPSMAKKASNLELREGFELHLEQTRGQVERLERIFDRLDLKAKGRKCKAMEGLIEEGTELMEEDLEPDVLDAGLIAAAQKVEHYEMASYGCVRTWARQLGHNKIAELLQQTLDEEGETDQKLTEIAERMVNPEAVEA
jgi:ferritin-like metal-binding protein YciE